MCLSGGGGLFTRGFQTPQPVDSHCVSNSNTPGCLLPIWVTWVTTELEASGLAMYNSSLAVFGIYSEFNKHLLKCIWFWYTYYGRLQYWFQFFNLHHPPSLPWLSLCHAPNHLPLPPSSTYTHRVSDAAGLGWDQKNLQKELLKKKKSSIAYILLFNTKGKRKEGLILHWPYLFSFSKCAKTRLR